MKYTPTFFSSCGPSGVVKARRGLPIYASSPALCFGSLCVLGFFVGFLGFLGFLAGVFSLTSPCPVGLVLLGSWVVWQWVWALVRSWGVAVLALRSFSDEIVLVLALHLGSFSDVALDPSFPAGLQRFLFWKCVVCTKALLLCSTLIEGCVRPW